MCLSTTASTTTTIAIAWSRFDQALPKRILSKIARQFWF